MSDGHLSHGANAPKLIVVRPRDRWAQTENALLGTGFSPLFCEVLTYSKSDVSPPDLNGFQAVVVTSLRALEMIMPVPDDLVHLPLYIVGSVSAARARDMGFQDIVVAERVVDLMAMIRARVDPAAGPLLYVRGDQVAYDIAPDLTGTAYVVREWVTYGSVPADGLSIDIINDVWAGNVRGILFFSAQSAAAFCRLYSEAGLGEFSHPIYALCLSAAVLECARNLPWARTYVAASPDMVGMVDLVRTLPVA